MWGQNKKLRIFKYAALDASIPGNTRGGFPGTGYAAHAVIPQKIASIERFLAYGILDQNPTLQKKVVKS